MRAATATATTIILPRIRAIAPTTIRYSRHTSTSSLLAPNNNETPEPLSMDLIVDVVDTTLMYIQHGKPGKRLDELNNKTPIKPTDHDAFATRWREVTTIWFLTQLHVIAPFGYNGLQQFAMEIGRCVNVNRFAKSVDEFQQLSFDGWKVVLSRGMGYHDVDRYDLTRVRRVASQFSAAAQTPEMLQLAETVNGQVQKSNASPENKADAMHVKVLMPLFRKAMGNPAAEVFHKEYAECQANLQSWGLDPITQNNVALGMTALMEKAPLLKGGV